MRWEEEEYGDKDLHAEEGEDEDEEEEEEEEGEDGGDGVGQGQHKVSQARPVPDHFFCRTIIIIAKLALLKLSEIQDLPPKKFVWGNQDCNNININIFNCFH